MDAFAVGAGYTCRQSMQAEQAIQDTLEGRPDRLCRQGAWHGWAGLAFCHGMPACNSCSENRHSKSIKRGVVL